MTEVPQWEACTKPQINDTLKWQEPIWAKPNKPRGKRDKIGEQEITATLVAVSDILEFKVTNVQKISPDEALLSVKESDTIRRKQSSIEKGNCHKLIKF